MKFRSATPDRRKSFVKRGKKFQRYIRSPRVARNKYETQSTNERFTVSRVSRSTRSRTLAVRECDIKRTEDLRGGGMWIKNVQVAEELVNNLSESLAVNKNSMDPIIRTQLPCTSPPLVSIITVTLHLRTSDCRVTPLEDRVYLP